MAARGWLAAVFELYVHPDPEGTEVVRAARECFRPLLRLLDRHRGAQVTVALDPALARSLLRHGQAGILQELAAGVERGQVELAGGASSHALLPRLPRREVERQIRLGHEQMCEAMGRSWRPQGLLPPALAFSRQVAEVAADRGLRWVLADELALGRLGEAPRKRVPALRGRPDILLFLRDRELSLALSLGEEVSWDGGYRVAVVPATAFAEGNAALAGLEKLLQGGGPMLSPLSALAAAFPDRVQIEPLPCSSRTSAAELAAGIPFAAWSAPDNEVQALLWHLVGLGLTEIERLAGSGDPAFSRMRSLFDEGLHSAPFRCASARPWWEPAVVRATAAQLASALEAGEGLLDPAVRAEAGDVQARLGQTLDAWERHRSWERLRGGVAYPATGGPELAG